MQPTDLVKNWRNEAATIRSEGGGHQWTYVAEKLEECADELDQAILAGNAHMCAKSDGTHMTDEQIAELHDQVSDDSGDSAFCYWEELGEAGKLQQLAFARALLQLNPHGDWEALANAVKALPARTSGDPTHSSPLECFWAELGDVALNDYQAVEGEAKLAAENLADIDAALRPLVPKGGSDMTPDGEPTPGEVVERAVQLLGERTAILRYLRAHPDSAAAVCADLIELGHHRDPAINPEPADAD
jgi:hypothetical protein